MQGSGTFGVESVFQTCTKLNESKVLVLENGAYGQRIEKICRLLSINHRVLRFPEERTIDCDIVKSHLEKENNYTHVVSIIFKNKYLQIYHKLVLVNINNQILYI